MFLKAFTYGERILGSKAVCMYLMWQTLEFFRSEIDEEIYTEEKPYVDNWGKHFVTFVLENTYTHRGSV